MVTKLSVMSILHTQETYPASFSSLLSTFETPQTWTETSLSQKIKVSVLKERKKTNLIKSYNWMVEELVRYAEISAKAEEFASKVPA
jgi:hypothetical protein